MDQQIKLHAGINRELAAHIEAKLLASELLAKCGVCWLYLVAEIEAFQMHLVNKTYGDDTVTAGIVEGWTMVLTMVRVI